MDIWQAEHLQVVMTLEVVSIRTFSRYLFALLPMLNLILLVQVIDSSVGIAKISL